jgi:Cft2 family RNA processing exonuclease
MGRFGHGAVNSRQDAFNPLHAGCYDYASSMSALTFRYHGGGIVLPRLRLWLDSRQPRGVGERTFVSHAHSDHIGRHQEVILSAPTARFLQARLGKRPVEHVLPFSERKTFETNGVEWSITLLPAGHILGSAMCLIEAADESILYTGDFKLRHGLSAELCAPRSADVLIMETTFGKPEYQFPPATQVFASLIRFCIETLDDNKTPVLFSYSLGKSQELLSGLARAGLNVLVHEEIHRLTLIYESFGRTFPPYNKYDGQPLKGCVLICPPTSNLASTVRALEGVRTAVVTGWALDQGCRFRSRTHAAFPLSDHADYPDLVEFVRQVAPKTVYTLHGFAADFAWRLRELGYDARALGQPEQLTLPLGYYT